MKSKVTVFDVAKYILVKTGKMTTMKLQKLVYYAQAWSLVWDDAPLFNNKIEAWANGPVVRQLYEKHRGYYYITSRQINGSITTLTAEQRKTIDAVVDAYGGFSSSELINLTHNEKPWKNARVGVKEGALCSKEISRADMANYYGALVA